MEQNNTQKPKCPTCNRTISKNMERYSITEFYRKVKKITDINSLNAIKDYIYRSSGIIIYKMHLTILHMN